MAFLYKPLIVSIIFLALLNPNISTSANIIDDLKNGFGQDKDKVKNTVKEIKNQTQNQFNETENESKKTCEIQKGYAIKHFENRKLERNNEIEGKITKMNKIKLLFSNNKQDVGSLNISIDNLSKLLKQKSDLLITRVKSAGSINCNDQQNPIQTKLNLQEINQKINRLDKDIHSQTRDFTTEVQSLVVKLKEVKVEQDKK